MLFWIIVAWIVWSLYRPWPYRRYRRPPMGGWHGHIPWMGGWHRHYGGWGHPPMDGFGGGFGGRSFGGGHTFGGGAGRGRR